MKIQPQIMSNADKQIHTTNFQSHVQKEVRPKLNDFSVAHLNVRGVTSKLDQIKDLLANYNFSILGLSETFLDDSKPSSFYHIDSYEIIRVDRIGRSGGGILCYLKSG